MDSKVIEIKENSSSGIQFNKEEVGTKVESMKKKAKVFYEADTTGQEWCIQLRGAIV